jgi:hypothetical protein
VLWEYPTTEALAHYVATALWCQGAATENTANAHQLTLADLSLDPEEADALLARLDALSDAEVDQLLNDLCTTKRLAA